MSTSIQLAAYDVIPHHAGMTLAERVRWARDQAGLGMNELDREIGQKSGYTSRLESGDKQTPDYRVIQRMAEVLKVRAEWLLFGTGARRGREPEIDPRIVAVAKLVPTATRADLEIVASMRFKTAPFDSLTDETIKRLLEDAVRFRRDAEERVELDGLKRARLGPGAAEQEANEDAERKRFRAKKPRR